MAAVAGIGVLLAERSKVEIAKDIETVIDGDYHDVTAGCHGCTVIAELFNGRACRVTAAMEPYHDRLFRVVIQ